MQFISWKTCRRAKGGRAFYLVSLHQPLLSMLYLGSFHPPADRRVYMGPSVKDLRHSHPESLRLPHHHPHRPRRRSDWQGQQDRELWCSQLVCVRMIVWQSLPLCVHVLMQDLSVVLCATHTSSVQQARLTSPLAEDVLQWDNRTFKQENGLLSLQN